MRFPTVLCLAACFLAAIGCNFAADPQTQPPAADPFGNPGSCPPGICPPGYCQPDYCPPGGCPPIRAEGSGIEIGSATQPYPLNALATNEVKSGDCIPCQQPVIHYQQGIPYQHPQVIRHPQGAFIPQARIIATPQQSRPAVHPRDEIKQGKFQCEKCKRSTVGADWQEIWTDDGKSLMCMCKECYQTSTPQQREMVMRNYLARHGIDPKKRPLMEAAVIQAARGY